MAGFDGPKSHRSEILQIAADISARRDCIIQRPDEKLYKFRIAERGQVAANLVWTRAELNKGIYKVSYPWYVEVLTLQ
jgi:hypothetical protein